MSSSFIIRYGEYPNSFTINLDTHAPTLEWIASPDAAPGLYTAQVKLLDPHGPQIVEAFLVLSDDDEVELIASPMGDDTYSLSASVPNVTIDDAYIEITVIDALDNSAIYTRDLGEAPPVVHLPPYVARIPKERRQRRTKRFTFRARVKLTRTLHVRYPAWVQLRRVETVSAPARVHLRRETQFVFSAKREPAYWLNQLMREDEELLLMLED